MKRNFFLALISFLTLAVALEAITPVLATTETRYMRNDTWSAGIYKLGTTNTAATASYLLVTYDGNVLETQTLGIRVWYGNSSGETEITSGTPVSEGTGNSITEISGAGWSCPQTTIDTSHYVVVKVYTHDAYTSYWLVATFRTEALSATQLDSATWNAYYHLYRTYTKVGGLWFTKYYLYWGVSTYDTRLTGFTYSSGGGPTAYIADLSKALSSSWTLATLTNYRVVPSQSLTSSWSVNLLHGMLVDLAESLTTSWELVTQTDFRTDFSQSIVSTWDFVTQSAFNLDLVDDWVTSWSTTFQTVFSTTLGFDAVTSWLVDVGQGLSYAVDLGLTVTTSWIADVVIEGSEAFLFFELWMDVLWIPLVASPFLLALWLTRRREEDE